MDTASLWQGTAVKMACLPTLQTDIAVDVAVVGAGITGLTAAMLLAAGGKTVAVLEAHRIGGSSTGHSTGNLYALTDMGLREIARRRGEATMRAVAESRASAVDALAQTIQALSLKCAFTRTAWHLIASTPETTGAVEEEHKAAQAAGLQARLVDASPLPLPARRTLRVENQAQFQPLDYVRQLAQHIVGDRCLVFENTPALAVDDANGEIRTPNGSVRCERILLATHTPVGVHLVQSKLDVVREYAVALRLEDALPEPGIYWVLGQDNYSLRLFTEGGIAWLVAVGAPHPTGHAQATAHPFDALECYARTHFKLGPVDYRWSAQRYRSEDLLPCIGRNVDSARTWIATGFSGDGLTYGTLAGMMVAEQMRGRPTPWDDLYSPSRLANGKRPDGFERERTEAAPSAVLPLDQAARALFADLPLCESRQLEHGGQKLAAFRCEDGRVLIVGAKCTHMGCDLQWNDAETSWDCHCHGSRFGPDGQVLEGPALTPLARAPDISPAGEPDQPDETGAED
ncbi:FAD-dependent oxidoreductase [Massilia solisilvae]|uniref:FAD-dependent oxidoreductase n=1 Tax=Massilia solisilvae TaxID=1811225 RepID=A0ABT2BI01_9BURK|nr:FAD-dependent oxidoreductase [Massilia solisilvae]MCS0608075.1 FAD-dependent oxidoreductase [Massilia solisilvae]